MERRFRGLDGSKDETAICVRREDGWVVLEMGRMSDWLHGELETRGLPVV